jgi:hypothetical protein
MYQSLDAELARITQKLWAVTRLPGDPDAATRDVDELEQCIAMIERRGDPSPEYLASARHAVEAARRAIEDERSERGR